MLQQHQRDRAAQAWLSNRITRHDLCLRTCERLLFYSLLNNRTYLAPGAGYFTHYHDHVRRQTGNEGRYSLAEMLRHLLQGSDGFCVTLIRESQQVFKTDRLFGFGYAPGRARRSDGFGVISNCRGVRRVHFPTTAIAATAFQSVLNQCCVAKLAGGAGRSLDQLVIEYQAATDTFGDGYDNQIPQAFGATTETNL